MKKSARIWAVSLFVSLVPSLYLVAVAFGLVVPQGIVFDYVSLGLGLLCTLPIWGAALVRGQQGKHRQDLLWLVATLISYGFALVTKDTHLLWQSTALTSTLLLGGWIQHIQTVKVRGALVDLASLIPQEASIIEGREIEHIETSELNIGDVVLVRPGMAIPADGYIIQGQSLVSEVEITGEVGPIEKLTGDWVLAGSQNLAGRGSEHGPLTIRVSGVGSDLVIKELENSVSSGEVDKFHYSKFATVASNWLTLSTVAACLVAGGLALVLGSTITFVVSLAVSVLVSSQVAVVAVSASLAAKASAVKAASSGVIIRSRESFDQLAKLNHVVFMKTGVLTRGYSKVGSMHLARNTSLGTEDELLALAASVELGTSHQLGHLMIEEATRRGLELPPVTDIAPIPGLGVSAQFDGSLVRVGNAGMVNVSGINLNPYDLFRVSNAYQSGSTVVFVSIDELVVGYIEFPDEVRPNSQQAIIDLSGQLAITVLSGDATGVVEKVTKSLGLTEFAAEVLSTRKGDWIKARRASGSKVLLVGDGHYDASALAEADVAYAFGAGPDVHLSSANIIQVSKDPLTVARMYALSRRAQAHTVRNIWLGLAVSLGLVVASYFGLIAPVVVLIGAAVSCLLNTSLVRLLK
jgi:Cu2+-exporting ATPase